MNRLDTCEEQFDAVNLFFGKLAQQHRQLRYAEDVAVGIEMEMEAAA
jgi:hypothetical protein